MLDHGRERTGAVGEGGPAHPDDILREVLQQRWRTGSSWLLDRCDEKAGRNKPHRPPMMIILSSAWL